MVETGGTSAELLSNPVVSPLIDIDEPAPAKAEVSAKPAPAAEAQKADRPDATDENAKPEAPSEQEAQKQSRRQRKLQIERDARIRAETRAEMAERALAEAKRASAPADKTAEPPRREDFQTDDAFLDAYIDFRADQRAEAKLKSDREATQQREAQSKTQAEQKALADDWTKRETEFRSKVPNYEDDVEDFLEEDIPKFPQETRRAIVEFGPEILHYLGTHPETVAEILKMSPARQVAAIGKIDVSGGPGSDADADEVEAPAPRPRAPEPPPPAKHVRQGSSAPAGLSDDMDVYVQQRRKQGARWAR